MFYVSIISLIDCWFHGIILMKHSNCFVDQTGHRHIISRIFKVQNNMHNNVFLSKLLHGVVLEEYFIIHLT